MNRGLRPFKFVVIAVAGRMNQRERDVVEYMRAENFVCASSLEDGGCGGSNAMNMRIKFRASDSNYAAR